MVPALSCAPTAGDCQAVEDADLPTEKYRGEESVNRSSREADRAERQMEMGEETKGSVQESEP